MPKIVITSRKPVLTAERGRLPHGIPVEVSDLLAQHLIEQGVAVRMETKEAMTRPTETAGKEEPLSALPVAQASPVTTQNESESGARKRGRPRKNAA
jgi:hypothetical protein